MGAFFLFFLLQSKTVMEATNQGLQTKLNRLQVDLEAMRQAKMQLELAYKEVEQERKADKEKQIDEKKIKKMEKTKDGKS